MQEGSPPFPCLPPTTQRSQVRGQSQHVCGVCNKGDKYSIFQLDISQGGRAQGDTAGQAAWHQEFPTAVIEVCWAQKSWRRPTKKGACQVHEPSGKGFWNVLWVGGRGGRDVELMQNRREGASGQISHGLSFKGHQEHTCSQEVRSWLYSSLQQDRMDSIWNCGVSQ